MSDHGDECLNVARTILERAEHIIGNVEATERFFSRIDKDGPVPAHRPDLGPCWLWTGPTLGKPGQPYGYFRRWKDDRRAHRLSYEIHVRPIPDGLVIDHLCRVSLCVNPAHLEPVTNRENVLRGISLVAQNARKTHCHRGHPFDGANTYLASDGSRKCIECRRESDRRYRSKRRAATSGNER